jgi:ferredoxin
MTDRTVLCRSRWPGRPDREVPVAAGDDVFSALRAGGVPIASSCTGRRICGRCLVTIIEGDAGHADHEEQAVLDREEADADERLACRVFPSHDGLIITAGYW